MSKRLIAYTIALAINLLPIAMAANSDIAQDPLIENAHQMITNTLADARHDAIAGPKKISLRDQASIDLPKDYLFIPAKAARAYMSAIGNKTSDDFVGLIMPRLANNWFITINFDKSGYISTINANHLPADRLFSAILQNIAEENKQNQIKGLPTFSMSAWSIKPVFNREKKMLTFGLIAHNAPGQEKTVNDVAVLLGRDGVLRLNLVTVASVYADDKVHLPLIAHAIQFEAGKAYADYIVNQDPVAGYDITTFVTGMMPTPQPSLFAKFWWTIMLIPLLLIACFMYINGIRKLSCQKGKQF